VRALRNVCRAGFAGSCTPPAPYELVSLSLSAGEPRRSLGPPS